MSQLTLFTTANETPIERKRKIETFDTFDLARRYALVAKGTGRYSDVYITRKEEAETEPTVVIMEWEEW